MSGTVSNVATWANADVLIGDLTATAPTLGTAFSATGGLSFLGLVTTDGTTESQSNDSTDISAFVEQGVIATVRSNLVYTLQVTAMEDSIVNMGLRYDASDLTAAAGGGVGYSGITKARDLTRKFKIGLQLTSGDLLKQRYTRGHAEIDSIGDAQESQSGVLQTQVTFKIYANDSGELWDNFLGSLDDSSSSSSSSSSAA